MAMMANYSVVAAFLYKRVGDVLYFNSVEEPGRTVLVIKDLGTAQPKGQKKRNYGVTLDADGNEMTPVFFDIDAENKQVRLEFTF